ncbi:MAG: hypothetical protein RLZZ262_1029 [Bacteroidota bacterium]|jgi:serine/tyrosine/threonine adenylyltransferase
MSCSILIIPKNPNYLCSVQELQSTYTSIDSRLFSREKAIAMQNPTEVIFNGSLATQLGLTHLAEHPHRAAILSGQRPWGNSIPFAQAYAGHQFGHFTNLGDGRALLLGEWVTPQADRFDIQLKGSGPTRYSRRGDGLATLQAMLREYIISESMHGLGIPTSRSLSVVRTGLPVYRESEMQGAVLARVAKSHIRVGTFEYVAQLEDLELLRTFTHYTIERHYPDCLKNEHPVQAFLQSVVAAQASLVCEWMRVGFIHGVMNTDNMSVAGETIDYGPCAFMNGFDFGTVFSSIDTQGRYAFGRQAPIAQWNLAVLASALLPLLDQDHDKAVKLAQECINSFVPLYESLYENMMRRKLGIPKPIEGDLIIIDELTRWMQSTQADYTQTFWALESKSQRDHDLYFTAEFEKIARDLSELKRLHNIDEQESLEIMLAANPRFIPRNRWVEDALQAAQLCDYEPLHKILDAAKQPYLKLSHLPELYSLPEDQSNYRTFCGT